MIIKLEIFDHNMNRDEKKEFVTRADEAIHKIAREIEERRKVKKEPENKEAENLLKCFGNKEASKKEKIEALTKFVNKNL